MGTRAWKALAVGLLATAVAYPLLPWWPAQSALATGVAAAGVLAVLVGARRVTAGPAAWRWLAAGAAASALADVVYAVAPRFPGPADLVHLGAYPLLIVGLVLFARARTSNGDRTPLLDAAIIATGVGVVAWAALVQPYALDSTLSIGERVVSIAYPAMDIALLAAVLRLAVGAGKRNPAFWLLAGALSAMLASDLVYAWATLQGSWTDGGALDLGWLAFYGLLGVAALHPSAPTLAATAPSGPPRLTRRRLAVLAGASLLAPTVNLATSHALGHDLLPVSASILLFLLVIARMAGLVRALERSMATVADLHRRAGERRFRSLVAHAADMIVVLDGRGHVSYASPSACRLLGSDAPAALSQRLLHAVVPEDAPALLARLDDARARADAAFSPTPVEIRVRRADGGIRHLEVVVTNLLDDPDVTGLVLNARDVTDRAALEQQLRHLAFHDPLTGLANRSLFGDRVEHALARARRGGVVAVLFCDLDDFKTVNDSLGHEAGDRLLVALGQRFGQCLRPGDTAARLGGDEFGVLLEDLGAPEEAEAVAQRVVDALRLPWLVDGRELKPSVSVGITVAERGQTAAEVLRDADTAMYHAKATGKARWRRYDPSMHADARERLELTADLHRALEGGEFFLVYQPIVDLEHERTVGVEALVRWKHPRRGVVPPLRFISLAEETGHIVELGRWVLAEACRQVREWETLAPGEPPLRVSVNVSARQLQPDGDLVDAVESALAAVGLEPSRLVIELTESVVVADPEQALRTFAALRALGVRLAIDDFGTGYSSLSYLQRLPVDIIKIDKTFVDDLGNGPSHSTLAAGILDLARSLGVTAVAEGIEAARQVDDLRALHCQLGQGYFLGRPAPADVVVAALPAPEAAVAPAHAG